MSGLTRQEMKRDEVQEQLLVGIGWFQQHWRKVVLGLVALLAAVTAFFVARILLEQRSEDAQAALGNALRFVAAPVVDGEADPDDAANPTFSDEQSRDLRAKAELEKVVEDYGSSDAANVARMLLARTAAEEGDFATAREMWQEALRYGKGTAVAAGARTNLISLDRQERPEELATELREMVDSGSTELPADALLFELAQTLEVVGKSEDAADVYQRIVDDFQTSPYVAQARERLQEAAATASSS